MDKRKLSRASAHGRSQLKFGGGLLHGEPCAQTYLLPKSNHGQVPRLEFFFAFEREHFRELQFSRRKLSQIAPFCHAKDPTPPNFAEKTFANSHKTAKFLPRVSRYTVVCEKNVHHPAAPFLCEVLLC